MKLKYAILAGVAAGALAMAAPTADAAPVGLELALIVDVSGSIDNSEYALQKQGYINAFNNPAVIAAIQASQLGSIAVTYIEWSGASQQAQLVGWTLVDDAASGAAFAAAIGGTARAFSGLTAPGSAINYAAPLFTGNGFEGNRLVIDVSGDGQQNDGANTAAARNAALAGSMTQDAIDAINGLAIGGAALTAWYEANIQGGAGSFTVGVDNFVDFGDAIVTKLVKEITGVPEPMTIALFGAGLAGLGMVVRRRRKAA